ncbi:uncharacterized protein BYT42DRAFT_535691 [Radiomyces spectabilis]|uniref:uncharacterized protein n=1 Tax=Radiomyces spectabilis TaxID=64574 RepID=UPI00221FD0FE|nr:uncharacterized protein BYT42DRAFT_535691 [Radiomyces spectabilis]KAI8374510.1 hypothetical protein BYT42DRAFT_535691 [Radiomyces spectabilis]
MPTSEDTETIDDDLLTFVLPSDYLPGMDLPSKRVLKTQVIADLIAQSLLQVSNGTYCSAGTEWKNGMRSDVLYTPRLALQTTLPPILVEVQKKLSEAFIRRIILYCLNITNLYPNHPLPVVLIFCIDKCAPRNLLAKFQPCEEKPCLKYFPSAEWADKCYLVSNEAPNDDSPVLSPLHALSLFFSQQQPSLHSHSHPEDPTVKKLYELIKALCEEDETYEDNFRKTINDVCDTHNKLYNRINIAIRDIPGTSKACRIIDRALEYNSRLKRKFSMIDTDSESSLELPPNLPMSSQVPESSATRECEAAFIANYRKHLTGRMDWDDCLQRGHEEGIFKRYSTGNSLRANFGSKK